MSLECLASVLYAQTDKYGKYLVRHLVTVHLFVCVLLCDRITYCLKILHGSQIIFLHWNFMNISIALSTYCGIVFRNGINRKRSISTDKISNKSQNAFVHSSVEQMRLVFSSRYMIPYFYLPQMGDFKIYL